MGGRVKPGIFRVALNTAALEYAHAVLTRWGRPAIKPPSLKEQAKQALFRFDANAHTTADEMQDDFDLIRRALEQLPDNE
jgi:hypothetical protein